MDEDKISRLMKLYSEYSDAHIIYCLKEGKDAYQPEVYQLLCEEARKRSIEISKAVETPKEEHPKKYTVQYRNLKRVYRYGSYPEASCIKEVLESNGIPVEVHSFENWGFDGVFRSQIGMGEILVADKFQKKAERLIEEYKKWKEVEVGKAGDQDKQYEREFKIYKLKAQTKGVYIAIPLGIVFILPGLGLLLYSFAISDPRFKTGISFSGIMLILLGGIIIFSSYREAMKARKELEKLDTHK